MIVNCLIKRIEVYRDYKLHSTLILTLRSSVWAWTLFLSPHKTKPRFFSEAREKLYLLDMVEISGIEPLTS